MLINIICIIVFHFLILEKKSLECELIKPLRNMCIRERIKHFRCRMLKRSGITVTDTLLLRHWRHIAFVWYIPFFFVYEVENPFWSPAPRGQRSQVYGDCPKNHPGGWSQSPRSEKDLFEESINIPIKDELREIVRRLFSFKKHELLWLIGAKNGNMILEKR